MTAITISIDERDKLREQYAQLESCVPKVYEPYPEKRKKLAKAIHIIDQCIKEKTWDHWTSWDKWDFSRLPLTFCFVCLYPAKLRPTVNPMTHELKKLECEICELIHYDSRYD